MFSALVALVYRRFTLKFFEAGHSYMSADSFHHLVEKESKKQVRLYDFDDYLVCVERVGSAMKMQTIDFKQWENQLSQGKASKNTRPLLENLSVAQFRKGKPYLFFKTSHAGKEFAMADFLKNAFKQLVMSEESPVIPPVSIYRGIDQSRKDGIVRILVPLMPGNRRRFWQEL